MARKLQRESSHHDVLDKSRAAFNMVIERYISMAHGLPPPPDDCPYQSPYYNKNKAKLAPLSSLKKNLTSRDVATKTSTVSPTNSVRQDSYFVEDDFAREVEESLQRRKKQLGLNDDFDFKEIEDDENDEDDPSWYGSHCHVRGNLSSRLHKKRGRKRKLTVNIIANTVGSSDESKSLKKRGRECRKDNEAEAPVGQVSLAQNKAAELRQLSFQHRLSDGSNIPRKRGRPPRKKTVAEVCDEGKMPRQRGRPPKAKVAAENQENPNQNKPKNDSGLLDKSKQPKQRGRPRKRKQADNQEKPAQHKTNLNHIRSADESNIPRKRGRPPKAKTTESQEIRNQNNTVELRRPSGKASEGIQPVDRRDEIRTACSNGDIRSASESNTPRKRGRPPTAKAKESQEIHNQHNTAGLRRPNDKASKGIQPANRKDESKTACSNGDTEEEQGPLEISDNIMELVQEAVRGFATTAVLHVIHERKNNIVCLLDTLDPVHIMVAQHSPSATSAGKKTRTSTEQASRKEKKGTKREQSIRTHANNDMEADTQQTEVTVNKTTNKEKRINTLEKQQTVGKTKTKPSEKPTSEANTEKIGKKRGSNTRTEFSLPLEVIQQSTSTAEYPPLKKIRQRNIQGSEHASEAVKSTGKQWNGQQSKSTVEHPTLKKMGQGNSQGSEHVCKAVKSSGKQRNGSSVPIKVPVATYMAKDAIPLSPGQSNTEMVPSSEVSMPERLHTAPDTGTEVTHQFIQHEPSNTSKSPTNQSRKTPESGTSNRSLSKSTSGLSDESTRENSERKRKLGFSESELASQDEDEWITTGDEDDTVSELNATRKKKSFLCRPQECMKRRKHKLKYRESVSRVVFDDDGDDILIMEAPKSTSENKKGDLGSDNSQSTRGVQDKPIMAPLPVSLKCQIQVEECQLEKNKRAADRHQGSLTTSSSYIQGLINNSMMKNGQGMMTTSSTKVPVEGQKKEDPDPEDMWYLLQVPSLHQSSSSILTSRAAKTNPQGSGIMETTASAPCRPAVTTTTTTTNISDSGITSKVSKSMRSFWAMDSDEETEDRESQDTESLFKSISTFASASQLVQESTVLPNYSTLGPERWMSVMRVMQKRKKNSFLKLPLR